MIKTLAALNWGLGLEILKTLDIIKAVRICGVITQHDEKSDDKWLNAVYDFSIRRGLRVMDQRTMDFADMKRFINEQDIDIMITHSYMRKMPSEIFTAPRYGSINIHPSLLPKYRGSSPTHWVLKNREKKTGLTVHFISEGIDEGDIINQAEVSVEETDTIDTIIEKQKRTIAPLLNEAFALITDTNFKPRPQLHETASYAPKPINRKADVRDIGTSQTRWQN